MPSDSHHNQPGQLPIYDVIGTHYPVLNVNQTLLAPYITKFKRVIAPINPFATQQIPSQDRVALGVRYGNHFFSPDAYPNGVMFSNMYPTHYDPLSEMDRKPLPAQIGQYGPGAELLPIISAEKLPRACCRVIKNYKRCAMINGEGKCLEEQNDIINVCPNFALHAMKERKRFLAKTLGIRLNKYREAMEISPYNEGRNVSDVEKKTWEDGTRRNLRPDTIWADGRYSAITQDDINKAKERNKLRAEKAGKIRDDHLKHTEHYDWVQVKYQEKNPPLYP